VPLRLERTSSRSSKVKICQGNLDDIDQKIIDEGFQASSAAAIRLYEEETPAR
tara:strand:- start:312 stop:470 length:159 start_codon:yes stop_codon:yes gene_type:complete